MDTATAGVRDREAMETRQAAVCEPVPQRREFTTGCTNRRKFSPAMAHCQQPCDEICISECLLQRARSTSTVHGCFTQSGRTAAGGPACPAVWQWRRGDPPPMPMGCYRALQQVFEYYWRLTVQPSNDMLKIPVPTTSMFNCRGIGKPSMVWYSIPTCISWMGADGSPAF